MKLKSAKEWSLITGIKLSNLDGWTADSTDTEKPISLDEFKKRIAFKVKTNNATAVVQEEKWDPPVYTEGFRNEIPPDFDAEWIGKIPYGADTMFDTIKNSKTIYEHMGQEKPEDDKWKVFIIDGGTGDVITSSVVLCSARKTWPDKKIIAAAVHSDMLENNPNIDKLYDLANPGDLFTTWVQPLKYFSSVLKRDIYNSSGHKLFPGPLSMVQCFMHGVPYPGDDKMKMYFTEKEDLEGKDYINSFTKAKGKPVVLIQCYGGRLTWNGNSMTDNKNWFPEYWEKLVQRLTKDFYVIQIGGPQEQQVPGCNFYMLPGCNMRQSAALLRHCLSYITIDSYANHAGPASRSNWGGVVLFGRSNPLIAGHRKNRNIWINESCDFDDFGCGRPQGYYGDSERYEGNWRPWSCPTKSCMRAITPEIVYDQFIDLIEKNKDVSNL